jgi:hypothetical protein
MELSLVEPVADQLCTHGYVPQTTDQLHAIADALEISYDRLLNLVLLCREAWEL